MHSLRPAKIFQFMIKKIQRLHHIYSLLPFFPMVPLSYHFIWLFSPTVLTDFKYLGYQYPVPLHNVLAKIFNRRF